jgi:hypothetical protein
VARAHGRYLATLCRWHSPLLHDHTTDNTQCLTPICVARPFVPPASLSDGLLDGTTTPARNLFRFYTSQTRSTVTASLYLPGGTIGEKLWYYVTVLTRKRGGKLGSAISHLRPMKKAKQVLGSFMWHSCHTRSQSVCTSPSRCFHLHESWLLFLEQPNPLPPLNNPTPEQDTSYGMFRFAACPLQL